MVGHHDCNENCDYIWRLAPPISHKTHTHNPCSCTRDPISSPLPLPSACETIETNIHNILHTTL